MSKTWVLIAAILGSSMSFVDASAVNVALPIMQRELHANSSQVQWVVEGYALFLAALVLVGGSLGDVLGRKKMFVLGVVLFAIASGACAIAPTIVLLIAARCFQGIGGALAVPESLALISATFTGDARGKAIGTWSGFASITGAAGPLVGGLLTGWWNAANALTVTIDYAMRTASDQYRDVVLNTFTRNDAGHFRNDFYDDEGWWALAWIKAFDYVGDAQYLTAAKTIFADMAGGWDDTCGGGIWWNKPKLKKNAIANELFLSVAAQLHLRTSGDGGAGSFLDWAQRSWSWFLKSGMLNASNLVNDGLTSACVNDGGVTWTYNQGVILGGLVALGSATADQSLTNQAATIADAAIAALTDADGILHEPNEPDLGPDGPQFKGIFVRNLYTLYQATGNPAYRKFFLTNADAIWSQDNSGDSLGGLWAGPFDKADASRQSSALDVLNIALLFDAD